MLEIISLLGFMLVYFLFFFRKRKKTKENSRLQISCESFCLYLVGATRIFEADFFGYEQTILKSVSA